MKKIITAINNPKLNEELKKETNFEIVGKDIQYKEAILEVLENVKTIDLIILSEKILGEIKIEELIKKIRLINEQIKIIVILEKENTELEKILIKNHIIDIYFNNQINLKELIKIINKEEMNIEEEIIKLKKIIQEKNMNYNIPEENFLKRETERKIINRKIKKIKDIIKKKLAKIKIIESEKIIGSKKKQTKIITLSGSYKTGKSTIALIISQYLIEKHKKVLLIDGDLEKQDLSLILKKNKKKNYKNNKFKYQNRNKNQKNKIQDNKILNLKKIKLKKDIINSKKLMHKKSKIYNYKIKKIINLNTKKIKKDFYFLNNLKIFLLNKKEKVIQKLIITSLKILKQNYDYIIIDLSQNNMEEFNRIILKESNINYITINANILGMREMKKLLKKYIKEWGIPNNSLHIISNRKDIISINKNLISNCFCLKNKIHEIKEDKIYYIFFNSYFKNKFLIKRKKIKKEINKIFYKLVR